MASKRGTEQGPARIMIEGEHGRRPFMRGIMVHSLMSRGVDFEDAYAAATAIRDRLRGRELVHRDEVTEIVEEMLGERLEERPVVLLRTITVREGENTRPFSKGVLAQSLLAAALAPDEAFRIAQEIEATLLSRGISDIDRAALRELVHETLARTSERLATRYRVWRDFQASDKPMVLLLAGAPGVGKTSLAQEVAHRLSITGVTSTDGIREVMRIMLSQELAPAIHASSYDAHRQVGGLDQSEDPVIEAYRNQAATVAIGAKAMIRRAIEENTSVILEGVSILPGMLDLEAWRDAAHVIFLAVATLEEDAFEGRFAARGERSERRPAHRYIQNLDNILRIQEHILELADHHGLPIVDNDSFEASVLSVLRHVTETLRKQTEK